MITPNFLCPFCQKLFIKVSADDSCIRYACSKDSLYLCAYVWTDLEGNIILYHFRQRVEDQAYAVYGDAGPQTTQLLKVLDELKSEDGVVMGVAFNPMFTLQSFMNFQSQTELDSIIPRLLNLKAFS